MPNVLVTGAGRGIGRVTALRLAASGWDVFAGVRREADGAAVAAESPDRIRPIRLDVTSADDIAALDERLPESLDAVVNNAGIVVGGPVEGLRIDDWRRQFEVNLFGQIAVTQAVLPRLRTSRGRVVFLSSLNGRVATPMRAAYNSSKYAIEGMADTLRMELRPWGIRVSLIEPAQTDTDIWRDADVLLEESIAAVSAEHRVLYAKHIEGVRKAIPMDRRMAASPDGVAAAIERALTARRPHARYVVGTVPKVQGAMSRITPTPVLDAVLRKMAGIPRKP
jgi:NAD(P)-dependent dehydrogenase (short-subunit alcohol dehydrogenase family)